MIPTYVYIVSMNLFAQIRVEGNMKDLDRVSQLIDDACEAEETLGLDILESELSYEESWDDMYSEVDGYGYPAYTDTGEDVRNQE